MIRVTQAEAKEIRNLFPNSPIVRTMKQDSKRKHYLATLDRDVQNLLAKLRNTTVSEIIRAEGY